MAGDFRFDPDRAVMEHIAFDEETEDLLEEMGDLVAEIAHDLAPTLTGEGADSIHGELDQDSESAFVDISWDQDHFYMGFKELGTEHESATPFLRPALDQTQT